MSETDRSYLLPFESAEVLGAIQPIVGPIYGGLEEAIDLAKQFFPEGKKIDPFLFPNLVRYYALERLEPVSLEIDRFLVNRLSNNGISVRYGEYHMRIWKADEGELPPPGYSQTKVDFYEQRELFPGMRYLKLAVIWDVTSAGTLKKLLLVCPKGDGPPFANGQAHWQIEIPHPVTAISADKELAQQATDDLPLKKPATKKKASGQTGND
jgi:hypothetical protein